MVRRLKFLVFFLMILGNAFAEGEGVDSLRQELSKAKDDTVRLVIYQQLSVIYSETKPDSCAYFAGRLTQLARSMHLPVEEAAGLIHEAYALITTGNFSRSLQNLLTAITLTESPENEKHLLPLHFYNEREYLINPITPRMIRLNFLGRAHQYLGILYGNTLNTSKELDHYMKGLEFARESQSIIGITTTASTLGRLYFTLKKPDSALHYIQMAYDLSIQTGYRAYLGSFVLNRARVRSMMGHKAEAIEDFRQAIILSMEQNYLRGVVASNIYLSEIYRASGDIDSSHYFAQTALSVAQTLNSPSLVLRSYSALAAFYRATNEKDSTIKYQELVIKLNDSLVNSKQLQQFQNIESDAQQKQIEIDAAKKDFQNKVKYYLLLAGIGVVLLIAILLLRNNYHRRRLYKRLQLQKEELEAALENLRTTQDQLIHAEKMASLGELTAGIAHEIENPLNFVNNFSEVNSELLHEMQEELANQNFEEVKLIAEDILANEEKIIFHGKRADSIVKGMLQHSRTNTGQKELTDLNDLADEYLRLSYHGLRAKDKSFNATLNVNFDPAVGKINVVAQDIGRVLLNLYNNAFYSVSDKAKNAGPDFQPTVSVSTKVQTTGSRKFVEIMISDNGMGVPQKILDKIFQPFFTTKPSGSGTGLGLSMSYDIIKVHGGEIKVQTKENEGATFLILLPQT